MAPRDFLIPLLSALASFLGAWLAAKLALNNFYRQKIWERRTETYTAIFEAIHAIERWHDKHFDASLAGREINEELTNKLRAESNKAEEDLERRLAGEAWLIPTAFRGRALRMTYDLKSTASKHSEWQRFLQESLTIISGATQELLPMAANDLRLGVPWYGRLLGLRSK
jgi:hypothetical protein